MAVGTIYTINWKSINQKIIVASKSIPQNQNKMYSLHWLELKQPN